MVFDRRWRGRLGRCGLRQTRTELRIHRPPVDADLASLVHGGDQEPDLNRQQFDVDEFDFDVADNDEPLVENPFEHVGQAGALNGVIYGGLSRNCVSFGCVSMAWRSRVSTKAVPIFPSGEIPNCGDCATWRCGEPTTILRRTRRGETPSL